MSNSIKLKYLLLFLTLTTLFITPGIISAIYIDSFDSNDVCKEENPKISAPVITIITPENITYRNPMQGYFPATYGFENESVGSTPRSFNVSTGSGCSIQVVDEVAGHKNVLEFDDQSGSARAKIIIENSNWALTNTYEFYVRTTDASFGFFFGIYYYTPNLRAYIKIDDNKFQHYDGTYKDVGKVADDNTWYHIRVDHTTSHYDLYIDGIQYGPYGYQAAGGIFNAYTFGTENDTSGFTCHVDALGFDADSNYNVGDNLEEGLLLSFQNSSSLDWHGYCLDGLTNKTIRGNTTIPLPGNGMHSIQIFGNDSFGEIGNSSTRYFSVDTTPVFNILSPENKTYTQPMNGYYPGSYGFENDLDGNIPENWNFTAHHGVGSGYVNNELGGHKKILGLNDLSTSAYPEIFQYFSSVQSGIVEAYIRKESGQTALVFSLLQTGGLAGVGIIVDDNNNGIFEYDRAGTYTEFAPGTYSDQTWYHLRIDFNTDSDTFDLYLNGVLAINNGSFANRVSSIDYIRFGASYAYTGEICLDAVGYSWDPNYEVGDNLNEGLLLSYDNKTSLDWIGYSLDGMPIKTISGATVIPMPDNGTHYFQLFGNDSMNNSYESDIIYFNVQISEPFISPYEWLDPIWSIIIVIVIIALIAFISVIFIKKRKSSQDVTRQIMKDTSMKEMDEEKSVPILKTREGILNESVTNETQKLQLSNNEMPPSRSSQPERKIGESREILERLRKLLLISNRIEINTVISILGIEEDEFYKNVLDWANRIGFRVDGNYIIFKEESISDFIKELEQNFDKWRHGERDNKSKL